MMCSSRSINLSVLRPRTEVRRATGLGDEPLVEYRPSIISLMRDVVAAVPFSGAALSERKR